MFIDGERQLEAPCFIMPGAASTAVEDPPPPPGSKSRILHPNVSDYRFQDTYCCRDLVDVDVALAQLNLGQLDLLLQLCVCLGDVVKCEDRETQTAQEIASKSDDSVEGELSGSGVSSCCLRRSGSRVATYHGDDFGLDGLVQGNKSEVEGEVELYEM